MKGSVWIKRISRTRLHALGKDKAALVGHAHHFVHRGQGSHGMQVGGLGRVQAGIHLGRHHNGPLLAQRLNQLDGAFPAHRQRQNGMRKQNSVPDRQNGDPAHSAVFFVEGSRMAAVEGWFGIECPLINFPSLDNEDIEKVSEFCAFRTPRFPVRPCLRPLLLRDGSTIRIAVP